MTPPRARSSPTSIARPKRRRPKRSRRRSSRSTRTGRWSTSPRRAKSIAPTTRASSPSTTRRSTKETKKYGKFDEKARQGDATGGAEQSKPQSRAQPPVDRRLAMREPQLGRPSARSLGPPRRPSAPRAARRALRRAVAGPAVARRCAAPAGQDVPLAARRWRAPGGAAPALMPSEQQMARADRQRLAGRAQGHRRRRRDGAELEALEVRVVLQPGQAAGRRSLAPRGGLPSGRSDRFGLRVEEPSHRAARAAQARRHPGQRRARAAVGRRVPRRRGDRGLQAGAAVSQSAAPAARSAA